MLFDHKKWLDFLCRFQDDEKSAAGNKKNVSIVRLLSEKFKLEKIFVEFFKLIEFHLTSLETSMIKQKTLNPMQRGNR